MASPYIKPASNAVNFTWTNDTYAQNAFNDYTQIQMLDGVVPLNFVETLGVHYNLPTIKNKYLDLYQETLGLTDENKLVFLLRFIESLGIHDDFAIQSRMNLLLQETIGLHDNLATQSKVLLVFSENLGLNDSLNLNATLNVKLQEMLGASDYLDVTTESGGVIVNDPRDTYSMNFKNTAFARYSNDFYFTSAIKYKNNYYMANNQGLFRNKGEYDGKSGIKTALIRFGGDVQSRIDYAFLAVKNNGPLSIKLIGSDGLEKVYTLTGTSETLKDKRVKFGKGTGTGGARKCSYFQFEITADGSQFELDNLAVYKLALSRKI